MSEQNKALVQRWFEEVWNKRRAAAIDEMLSAEAIVHGLDPAPAGNDRFKQFHAAFCNGLPDLSVRIEASVAEGDLVAVRWSVLGTHRGDGLGFPATGKRTHFTGMSFFKVKGGKFVEGWNNFDQLGMLQQVGIVTLPQAD